MTLNEFLKYVETRKPLKGDEIHQFMNKMSDEARRMTFELNGSYHAPEEIRELLSRLFNKPVDPSFRVFPPFYTDFGKNITVGKNVFINACCHFQDHGGVTLVARSGITWSLPPSTTASPPRTGALPTLPRSF